MLLLDIVKHIDDNQKQNDQKRHAARDNLNKDHNCNLFWLLNIFYFWINDKAYPGHRYEQYTWDVNLKMFKKLPQIALKLSRGKLLCLLDILKADAFVSTELQIHRQHNFLN